MTSKYTYEEAQEYLYEQARGLRTTIRSIVPRGTIVPAHTASAHYYMCNLFPGSPLYSSVTTKLGVYKNTDYKDWAVREAMVILRLRGGEYQSGALSIEELVTHCTSAHGDSLAGAGEVGTHVHDALEKYLKEKHKTGPTFQGKALDYLSQEALQHKESGAIKSATLAGGRFIEDEGIIPVFPELLVASKRLETAGSLDLLALIPVVKTAGKVVPEDERSYMFGQKKSGRWYIKDLVGGREVEYHLGICDWKTSNSIVNDKYIIQTSVYGDCLKELTGLKPTQYRVIRLDKSNGIPEPRGFDLKTQRKAVQMFKPISKLYDLREARNLNYKSNTITI